MQEVIIVTRARKWQQNCARRKLPSALPATLCPSELVLCVFVLNMTNDVLRTLPHLIC